MQDLSGRLTEALISYFWQGAPNNIPQLGLAVGVALFLVLTTLKDLLGLLIYFSLVNWLIGVT